jgi:hypothetical protein
VNGRGGSATTHGRLLLAAASALAAAVMAAAVALGRWVTGVPSLPVAGGLVAVVALLGPASGLVPPARRASGGVLVAAAWTAAVALAGLLGLAAMLLALGRLPDGREQGIVAAAAVGLVLATLLAGPLPSRAATAARRAAGRAERRPDDLLAAFADQTAGGAPLAEPLRELAESLRRAWRLSAIEVWTGGGDALDLTVAVPARPAPVTRLDIDDLSRLRRVGVAGPGWLARSACAGISGTRLASRRGPPSLAGRNRRPNRWSMLSTMICFLLVSRRRTPFRSSTSGRAGARRQSLGSSTSPACRWAGCSPGSWSSRWPGRNGSRSTIRAGY